MMWWAVWCAILVAGGAGAAAAPAPDSLTNLTPLDLVQIDPPAPDDEGVSYEVPAMGGRYAAGSPWLYLLAEMPRDSQVASIVKRQLGGFSVNPAVDVLQRGAYNNFVERMVHNNRDYLNRIGKRGWQRSHEAANAIFVHRPADDGAAAQAQSREGEEAAGAPGCC